MQRLEHVDATTPRRATTVSSVHVLRRWNQFILSRKNHWRTLLLLLLKENSFCSFDRNNTKTTTIDVMRRSDWKRVWPLWLVSLPFTLSLSLSHSLSFSHSSFSDSLSFSLFLSHRHILLSTLLHTHKHKLSLSLKYLNQFSLFDSLLLSLFHLLHLYLSRMPTVWPDFEIKSSQILTILAQK